MVSHWQWALESALRSNTATHIAFSRDRTLFKPGAFIDFARIIKRHPTETLAYHEEVVRDFAEPIELHQVAWTGRLLRINSRRQLNASAAVEWYFYASLPRVQNCVVPREVFLQVQQRFGSFFASIAPDVCFAYRCLALVDSYLYLDKPMNLSYAHDRSNGTSQTRGIITGDHADFLNNLRGRDMNFAAPIPEFMTVVNAIMHEYCFVKRESGSPRFPDINISNYLKAIAIEISRFESPQLRQEMERLMRQESAARRVDVSVNSFRWPERPLVTPFRNVDAAIEFAMKRPSDRTDGLAYEEMNGVASLALGGQSSVFEYVRASVAHIKSWGSKCQARTRRALDRHLFWRLEGRRTKVSKQDIG